MNLRPIDNLRMLLEGGRPAWIPFTLDVGAIPGFTAPIQRTFQELTGQEDPAEYFGSDIRLFCLDRRFGGQQPAALHGPVEPGTTFDEWGIGHWAGGLEGTVEKIYPPLEQARSPRDVEDLPSPIIQTEADTSAVADFHAAGYPVWGYAGSIYEWSWWLRGMQQFLMDLVDDPPMARAILRKVEEHTTRLALATARAGVDILCFYDDAGTQRGMQLSPALWREYLKPAWQRVLGAVRRQFPDVRFFLHCCGKIDLIVPDIIELGFHILHPVQPECMDFEALWRAYGARIVLAGTISAQRLFPFGSPEDVRRQVRRLAAIATDRRTILMPSNRIQPETPWENVVAFAEQCRLLRA
ncbi:MAG: uroporphyrinogen decarboxylase family protein [Thermoguttaceae bacterium]